MSLIHSNFPQFLRGGGPHPEHDDGPGEPCLHGRALGHGPLQNSRRTKDTLGKGAQIFFITKKNEKMILFFFKGGGGGVWFDHCTSVQQISYLGLRLNPKSETI